MLNVKTTNHPQRPVTRLKRSLDRSLNAYTVAACTAGISLLGLTQSAEGKIVFTVTHKTIFPNTTQNIDLNNDGTADFRITNFSDNGGTSRSRFFNGYVKGIGLLPSNSFVAYYHFAAALLPRVPVNSQAGFVGGNEFMFNCHRSNQSVTQTGPWTTVTNRYLGLKFSIMGQTHYGWARLSSKQNPQSCAVTLVLTGYAYETVANKGITTGKTTGPVAVSGGDTSPSSEATRLGCLALGTGGLSIWRREEESTL